MVQKYIIDKADIHNLLTGKEIPLEQGNKARAFCVEIAGGMTNGEVIKALFPNALRSDYIENDMLILYLQDESESEMVVPEDWWNSPYQKGGE